MSLDPALLRPVADHAMTVAWSLLAYGNLRGVREAGRAFALPTYFFVGSAGLVVVIGVVREIFGDLPVVPRAIGRDDQGARQSRDLLRAAMFVLMKAFANGGASLTGLEAISNGVSAFKKPAGRNAGGR